MYRALLVCLYAVTIVAVIILFVNGLDYYKTDYKDRPRHEDYRSYRPAASRGLLYGYIGAGMMILMLTYTLRKRTKLLGKLFTLRNWLDLHIYLGIFGPLFIVLHTSFKVQGLVAVSFWSMVIVALSGYFGRYLYLQIPRNIQGNELSLNDVETVRKIIAERLRKEYGLDDDQIASIDRVSKIDTPERLGALGLLKESFTFHLIHRRQLMHRIESELSSLGVDYKRTKQLLSLLSQRILLQRRIGLLAHVQRLFHYWHVVHKPFAIIMYAIMLVHIGVAVWTGYGWNF